eukprot:scaffold282842_cov33-Tisochrysis_lutea.AAC.2
MLQHRSGQRRQKTYRFSEEVVAHHEEGVNGLVDSCSTKSMARERLGRAHVRLVSFRIKDGLNGVKFLQISDRRGGTVGVDVVNLLLATNLVGHRHSQLHASLATNTRWGDHVVAVGVRGIAYKLSVDLGAASLGMLKLLEHDNTAAARNNESIAGHIKGAGRRLGRVVIPVDNAGLGDSASGRGL